ncbi:MAG: YggT family protein [Gallionellaceae bacterium]|jgi:YggT family protein|nr:YggT family protein [Gallionellaceae bacterium]
MLNEALLFLLDMLLQPFAAILLLRFHLQWLRAPLRNPAGEFIMVLTDFLVLRARRFIPSVRGLDSATLLLALLVEMLYLTGVLWAQGQLSHGFPFPGLLVLAAVKLLKISLYLLMAAVFAQAILSWVNPHTSAMSLLNAVTRRFLLPLRRIVPLLGNVDLSPLLLFIICQLIVIVPVGMLERLAFGLF